MGHQKRTRIKSSQRKDTAHQTSDSCDSRILNSNNEGAEGREQAYLQRTESKIIQPPKFSLGNMKGIKTLPEKPIQSLSTIDL